MGVEESLLKVVSNEDAQGKTRPLRILVAEDDPHDQMLFVMAADDCQAELSIDFAPDGEVLLHELRARSAAGTMPDLLVLDMRMPKLDGHEVLRALADEPAIRPREVGVFSSSFRQQDIDRSMSNGASWHEVKPSKYEDLVNFVRRIAMQTVESQTAEE